jgi:hypothetical protein
MQLEQQLQRGGSQLATMTMPPLTKRAQSPNQIGGAEHRLTQHFSAMA